VEESDMGHLQQSLRKTKIFLAVLLALAFTGILGIDSVALGETGPFSIASRVFNQRPTHLTPGFIEYESPDRSYAFQHLQPSTLQTWQMPSIQGLTHVQVHPPLKVDVGSDVGYLRDRRELESVAEYLLRHLILHIDSKDLTSVSFDRDIHQVALEENQKKIWEAYRELTVRGIEGSALNLFVQYADPEMTKIAQIIYEPTPQNPNKTITAARSIPEMVELFSKEISEVLKSGFFPYKGTLFADVQKNETYVSRKNVAGRELRIAGVTESYEEFLTQNIRTELKSFGYELVEAYFFGSRVITRDVLLQIDPSLAGNLGLNKGKLVKNQVRDGGLTSVSDMEIFLVVKPLKKIEPLSESAQDKKQLELRDQLRDSLNRLTRRYSLGMKILMVDKDSHRSEYFSMIQKELWKKKTWLASPEQYAKFYPSSKAALSCPKLFNQ
jgi:predicted nucleotidyltransferase